MKTIKATGRSSHESVGLTKAQADLGENELEVLLDDPMAAVDVRRFLESRSYSVLLRDDDGMLTLSARRKNIPPAPPTPSAPPTSPASQTSQASAPRHSVQAVQAGRVTQAHQDEQPVPSKRAQTLSVLVTRVNLGQGNRQDELGEALMKNFLLSLAQAEGVAAVALVNEGVKLAVYDSSSCDHLKNLEKRGVPILLCGASVNYFQIADQMGTGAISNMQEILETLNAADKIMTL